MVLTKEWFPRRRIWDSVPRSLATSKDVDLTMPLSTLTDPVLAELWGNEEDEAYDRLQER